MKKEVKEAIKLIEAKYGEGHIFSITPSFTVEQIAELMIEYAKPYKDEVKGLNKLLNDPEELGEYLAGI